MEYEINRLQRDEFGRVNGLIAVNKPAGVTSHDVVASARRALATKKVGHAGALDPFATGLLVLLVGKATKLSDSFLNANKEYVATILFGVSTDSADPEGNILDVQVDPDISELEDVLKTFDNSYEQYVPVFSSVKVEGEKLRVMARKYEGHELFEKDNKRFARFFGQGEEKIVEVPKQHSKIFEIELIGKDEVEIEGSALCEGHEEKFRGIKILPTGTIRVACSKGTYVRTLAEDIGKALRPPVPAMLLELERTRIGDIDIDKAVSTEDLGKL